MRGAIDAIALRGRPMIHPHDDVLLIAGARAERAGLVIGVDGHQRASGIETDANDAGVGNDALTDRLYEVIFSILM